MSYNGTITAKCGGEVQVFTGIGNCNKQEGKTVALLVTRRDAFYPLDGTEFNTNLTGVNGYVNADSVLRIIPINNIINNTPNGGDIATSEVGFAGARPVGYNGYSELYQVDAGDCMYKQLAQMNKTQVRVFRVDDQGSIYGTAVQKNGETFFAGFEAYLMTQRAKGSDNSVVYALSLGVYYSANYGEKELPNLHSFVLDEVPTGLIGVTLQKGATTGTAKVVSICDGEDYTAMYGSDWATTLFEDEAGVSPTTVTFSASTGLLTFAPIKAYRVKGATALIPANIQNLEGVKKFVDLT